MEMKGKEYVMAETAEGVRNIHRRRVVYSLSGEPTPEQKSLIDRLEKGVVKGEWEGRDPYSVMREVESRGIEFHEQEMRGGMWYAVEDPDILVSTMQTGAL